MVTGIRIPYGVPNYASLAQLVERLHDSQEVRWFETSRTHHFAVPASDVGDATFNAEERAMLLMRYIRKQLEANKVGLDDSLADVVPNCC